MAPPRCVYKLIHGADDGRYAICITPTQNQRLFSSKKPKKIGCGAFACAYEKPGEPDRVVKITSDATDIEALRKLQKTKTVAKVHNIWRLASPVFWEGIPVYGKHIYAVEVERLKPIDTKTALATMCIQNRMFRKEMPKAEAVASCCTSNDTGCARTGNALYDIAAEMKRHGVDWRDMHPGNIGRDAQGNLKVLDVGLTKHQVRPETVVALARAQQKNRKLRRI